jgi:hypothetical protein
MTQKFKTGVQVSIALFEGWEKFGYDENYYDRMIRTMSDVIYQSPKLHSGYASKKASNMLSKDVCREHYYSRTASAKKMVELMKKGILGPHKIDRFEKFMRSRARVHFVTSEENTHLIKFQSDPSLRHWKKQYEAAGIELERWDTNKYLYRVDGREFSSAPEVAAAMNCHASTVTKRCTSDKWPTWERSSRSGGA